MQPARISVHAPSPDLRWLIDHFQWVSLNLSLPEGFQERVVPTPRYSFVFQLGAPYQGRHQGRSEFRTYPGGLIATPVEYPVNVRPTGSTLALRVALHPHTAELVLKTNAFNVRNAVPEIADLLGPTAGDLTDQMSEQPDAARCIAIFESWIRRHVMDNQARRFHEMRYAMQRLAESAGQLRIRTLANELSVSERQLERWFLRSVGLRPKFFQRVVRVNAVIDRVRYQDGGVNWADLALASGYADQSHLVREFTALAGEPPASYLRNVQLMRLVFQDTLRLHALHQGDADRVELLDERALLARAKRLTVPLIGRETPLVVTLR